MATKQEGEARKGKRQGGDHRKAWEAMLGQVHARCLLAPTTAGGTRPAAAAQTSAASSVVGVRVQHARRRIAVIDPNNWCTNEVPRQFQDGCAGLRPISAGATSTVWLRRHAGLKLPRRPQHRVSEGGLGKEKLHELVIWLPNVPPRTAAGRSAPPLLRATAGNVD